MMIRYYRLSWLYFQCLFLHFPFSCFAFLNIICGISSEIIHYLLSDARTSSQLVFAGNARMRRSNISYISFSIVWWIFWHFSQHLVIICKIRIFVKSLSNWKSLQIDVSVLSSNNTLEKKCLKYQTVSRSET